MTRYRLSGVAYEPPGRPSLFDRWEAGAEAELPAPLAVRDADYRAHLVAALSEHPVSGSRLVSVGAGNGYVEVALATAGWKVLATDPAESALRHCRAKGLSTARFALMDDPSPAVFDAIYCDGVMGHLWQPASGTACVWEALASLGRGDSICLVSNDLSDSDARPQFEVTSTPGACFYRPPAGWFRRDAEATRRWKIVSEWLFPYARGGRTRRRELLIARLLVHERVEAHDSA